MEEKNYLTEAFKSFDDIDVLNEEVFNISYMDGIEKAKEFEDEVIEDDEEEIIDTDAEDEEEIKDDYVGKAILECAICGSLIYKEPSEVVVDEELNLANIGEACPVCQSEDGYTVIGEIKPFCDNEECEEHKEDNEPVEEVEETEEEIDVEEEPKGDEDLDESIKTRKRVRIKEEKPLEEAKPIERKHHSRNLDKIRKTLAMLGESSERDKIDADTDDKKERARKRLARRIDDADANRDYKLKKANLKESDKPAATSIEDAQKWVDYDMKKYGKISERTNRLVKKAGFQILKDDHGDYEVAAGKFESFDTFLNSPKDLQTIEFDKNGKHYEVQYDAKTKTYGIQSSEGDESEMRNITKADLQKLLKEDFQKVDIETDREKMTMTAEENGKVIVTTEPIENIEEVKTEEETEVIAPISAEVEDEFKSTESEENEDEYADVEFDEFDEEEFDTLGENYLRKVYENVKSFKTTSGSINGNQLKLEGLITFKSGKVGKTNFVFESYKATKTGKLKFIGENKQFAQGKKSFVLTGRVNENKLICESLTYNYSAKTPSGNTKRLYGTIRK